MAWTLGSDHRTMSDSLRVLLSLKANNNCTKSTPKPFWIRLLVIISLERDTLFSIFPGADWKLHLYGRVFYEGNCYEGKVPIHFAGQLNFLSFCIKESEFFYFLGRFFLS